VKQEHTIREASKQNWLNFKLMRKKKPLKYFTGTPRPNFKIVFSFHNA